MADAVTAQAPDGRLLFANDAALDLLGFDSFEELQSAPRRLDRATASRSSTRTASRCPPSALPGRRALAGERGAEEVVRFRLRATGEERWSAVKATPILDEDGFVTMAINVIEDITTTSAPSARSASWPTAARCWRASLEPTDVLGQVATLAVPEVADWVAVHMPGESGIELVALAHGDPELVQRAEELDRQMPTRHRRPPRRGERAAHRQSELYPDIPQLEPETEDERARAEHVRALRDALGAGRADDRPRQDARHDHARHRPVGPPLRRAATSSLAEELARRCGTAVDNARLFAERAYIARTLQQSLLPAELPDIPGIEAAARFRPDRRGQRGRRRLLRPVRERRPRLDGGDGRRVRQGPRRRGRDGARALHAARRGDARAPAQPQPRRCSTRRCCASATTGASARSPTRTSSRMTEGARIGFASGGHPLPLLLRADGTCRAGRRARHAARACSPTRASRTARCRWRPATRWSSTRTA